MEVVVQGFRCSLACVAADALAIPTPTLASPLCRAYCVSAQKEFEQALGSKLQVMKLARTHCQCWPSWLVDHSTAYLAELEPLALVVSAGADQNFADSGYKLLADELEDLAGTSWLGNEHADPE